MHNFYELVQSSTAFSLNALEEALLHTIDALQTSGATSYIKTFQMVQLQKAISAVGMFSMFDAMLQNQLNCKDGFKEAGRILEIQGKTELNKIFSDLQLAINVLKHGKGRSYNELVEKANTLPFKVKRPDECFFDEGNVAEVATLVEADDAFVLLCATVIHDVSVAVSESL